MPKCNKCNKSFPNRIIIDGKERALSNRRYCLDCSPFGEHNTRSLELKSDEQRMQICKICGKKIIKGYVCCSCKVNRRKIERKKQAIEYKGGKCEKCGYKKCITALEFHHKNPSTKLFSISGNHCKAWEKLKKELDKCVLVCSNCHREIHEISKPKTAVYKPPPLKLPIIKQCQCCKKEFETKRNRRKFCSVECRTFNSRKVKRPSKDELKSIIDSKKSLVQIGKEFGVSDNAVRKWVKQYKI